MNWRALSLAIVILLPLPPAADAQAVPVASGEVKPQFARMLFSWPQRVGFKVSLNDRTLRVVFDKAANPNLGSITGRLGAYVESARMADARTALITLRHPYPIRTFVSSSSSGIDLLQIHSPRFAKPEAPETAKAEKAKAEPKKAETQKGAKAEKPAKTIRVKEAASKPSSGAKIPTPPKAREVAKPTPAPFKAAEKPPVESEKPRQATAAPVEPITVSQPSEATVRSRKTATSTAEKVAQNTLVTPEPASSPPQIPPVESRIPSPAPSKPAPAAPSTAATGHMPVAIEKKRLSADFHFPWKERVAAAAFVRGSDLWVVFNKPAAISLEALRTVLPPFITGVEQLPIKEATVLRFSVNETLSPSVAKLPDSYEWTVSVSRRSQLPQSSIVPTTNTQPPLKPFIFLPVLEAADPVEIVDAASGTDLTVVPTFQTSQGVFPGRRFVDADIRRTAQGIAIEKLNDRIRIVKLRNGIRLTTPEGAQVSNNLPTPDPAEYAAREGNAQTFFPYDLWKVENETAFRAHEESLRRQISEAPDPKVSKLRKQLAELYLGAGMAQETLGVLNLIRQTDPTYFADSQLSALHGAANFLANRIEEASLDFGDPSLDGEDEIDFWRRVVAVMRGAEKRPIKFMDFHAHYEKSYPPALRRRLALIAADQEIGDEDYPVALHIMDTLKEDHLLEPVKEYQDFMLGRIYAETDQAKQAETILQKLLDTSNDRFIRARAGFTLATTKYKAGEIDKHELMKQLDALRIVWRGDQQEINLLELLGDLYAGDGQYLEALRAWKELLSHYPNMPDALAISGKMADTFVKLFNGGEADKLKPLEALAIYYEFHDLTPIGKDGDTMIQNLADRLASVDLLDRSAALLEHQITYRLEKAERSRVGARLALIDLLNKQPSEAIKVLELTGYGDNDEALQQQRLHLAANAYAASGDSKTALGLLKEDFTPEGKQIRLDIYWDAKDWPNVVSTAEDMLAARKNITAPLDDTESQTLLRLAVAYTFEDDQLQLQYLRDYFTPLMAGSPNKDAFDFITSDSGPIGIDNIQKVSDEMGHVKLFLDKYRHSVAKSGLSGTIK